MTENVKTTEPSVEDKKDKKKEKREAAPEVVVPAARALSIPTRPAVKPRISFEQWVKQRNIPVRHLGGLRAFVKNVDKKRTSEEWSAIFAKY